MADVRRQRFGRGETVDVTCACGAIRRVALGVASRVTRCEACQEEANREGRRRWKQRNRDSVRAAHLERMKTPAGVAWNREHVRRSVDLLRRELHDAYGWKCACCDEDEPAFLTFDHPNSDGADMRRQHGSTHSEWRAVRRAGFPEDYFVVLCFNCNMGRQRHGGVCPHAHRVEAVA